MNEFPTDEREMFEMWATAKGFNISMDNQLRYKKINTRIAWITWSTRASFERPDAKYCILENCRRINKSNNRE